MTPQQKELLDWIRRYMAEHEYAPSYDEMRAGIGLGSKSGIHRMIEALIAQRRLRKVPGAARSLEIVETGGYAAALVGVMVAAALKDHVLHDPGEEPLLIFTEQEFRRFLIAHLGAR